MSHSRPSSVRGEAPLVRLAGWVLLCILATPVARAETTLAIQDAKLTLDDNVYELDAHLAVDLPAGAQGAIDDGIAMRLRYEIGIARVRAYLPDSGVASLVQRYELNYHALSQRYLVRNLNTGEQFDFGSLQAALDRLGEIRGLPVIDSSLLVPGSIYDVRVRAVLDLGGTPDALKWLLFWTDDWSGASEWYAWTLRP
jgi:hypothetical protein